MFVVQSDGLRCRPRCRLTWAAFYIIVSLISDEPSWTIVKVLPFIGIFISTLKSSTLLVKLLFADRRLFLPLDKGLIMTLKRTVPSTFCMETSSLSSLRSKLASYAVVAICEHCSIVEDVQISWVGGSIYAAKGKFAEFWGRKRFWLFKSAPTVLGLLL